MTDPTGKTVILGLGNVLMGDDALGPFTVRMLDAEYEFGPGVLVVDAGTPGLDLAPLIMGARALIVVDTVRAEGEPGSLRIYRRDDLLRHPPGVRVTPHDPGLAETLLTLELHGSAPPEVVLVGVIPRQVATGVVLSVELRQAVPRVQAAVLAELESLGEPVRRRTPPLAPDIWWERKGRDA